MNLYLIQFDAQDYYVEASDFTRAIESWKIHVSRMWGADYDGTEQPESVALIHDDPFIRPDELEKREAQIDALSY